MARVTKRPTAKSRVRKIDHEILNSQIFSQETQSGRRKSLPREKPSSQKSLVGGGATLFTPNRKNRRQKLKIDENANLEKTNSKKRSSKMTKSKTEDEDKDKGENEKELPRVPKETNTSSVSRKITKEQRKIELPTPQKSWKLLTPSINQELTTLLDFLLPESYHSLPPDEQTDFYVSTMIPLFSQLASLPFPSMKSTEFDLSYLEAQNEQLEGCYDVSTTQLASINKQVSIEKKGLNAQKEYLVKFKRGVENWKKDVKLEQKGLHNDKFIWKSNSEKGINDIEYYKIRIPTEFVKDEVIETKETDQILEKLKDKIKQINARHSKMTRLAERINNVSRLLNEYLQNK